MRVLVDTNRCAAHGDCMITAPEVFDLDDNDDVVALLQDNLNDETLIAAVQHAVDRCPTSALRLAGKSAGT